MLIKTSKIYVSPEEFYTIEEVRLNYHCEYFVYKNGVKDGTGEYFKTVKDALKYIESNCDW